MNWGRAGKDARGPKCLPARSSVVVPVYRYPAQPPLPTRPGGEGVHTAQISPERAILGAPAPSPAFPPKPCGVPSFWMPLLGCAGCHSGSRCGGTEVGVGVNWGRAGKDARGPKCLPARCSLVVSAHLLPPFQLDQGEKAFARPRSRSSVGPPTWSAGIPARSSLPSHVKSLHCECPSLVVRAVIQAVVVAGLGLAWE